MSKIIFMEEGTVSFIVPARDESMPINPATGEKFTIEEIAKKDVPTGLKYKIIDDADLPTDKSFRNAWVVDEADLTDGVGE